MYCRTEVNIRDEMTGRICEDRSNHMEPTQPYGTVVVVVVCGLTPHSAIFQLHSDGTDVQFPNFDLLPGTHAMGS